MDVVIDGSSNYDFTGEPCDALAAVAEISDFLRERGRAVVTLTVDGETVRPDTMLDALAERPLSEVGRIEVMSEEVGVLVRDALNELEEVLPELPQACRSLAEVFQSESPEEGFEPFCKLADIWGAIKVREIQIADALELEVDGQEIGGETIGAMHKTLNEYLDEAAEALKANDCILLGDLLEYELAPRAEKEIHIAAFLRARAQGQLSGE